MFDLSLGLLVWSEPIKKLGLFLVMKTFKQLELLSKFKASYCRFSRKLKKTRELFSRIINSLWRRDQNNVLHDKRKITQVVCGD
ncbi:hypothetical protein L6452_36567 [Arctium lappa]|uniref:Uncharacterized protein n=1 Tax=Arctium lappa TaxID=4217 RepID=A0ACB8YAT5_ARCLA|nr:hypothetical protein L6452_36567 [Arctium lappa]